MEPGVDKASRLVEGAARGAPSSTAVGAPDATAVSATTRPLASDTPETSASGVRRRSSSAFADRHRLAETARAALQKEPDDRSRPELLAIWHWLQDLHPRTFQQLFKQDAHLNAVVKEVLLNLRLVRVSAGTVLFRQGEKEDRLFLPLSGTFEVRRRQSWHRAVGADEIGAAVGADIGGATLTSAAREALGDAGAILQEGDLIGEPYSPSRAREHSFSIVGTGSTGTTDELLALDSQIYRDVTKRLRWSPAAAAQARVDEIASQIRTMSIFSGWDAADVHYLAWLLKEQNYKRGDHLGDVGDEVDNLTFVLKGSVALTIHNKRSVTNLTAVEHVVAPAYFGEERILTGDESYAFHIDVSADDTVLARLPIATAVSLWGDGETHGGPAAAFHMMDVVAANRGAWRTMRLTGRDAAAAVPVVFLDNIQASVISFTDPVAPEDPLALPSKAKAYQRASEAAAAAERDAIVYDDGSYGVYKEADDGGDTLLQSMTAEVAEAHQAIRDFCRSFLLVRIFVSRLRDKWKHQEHLEDLAYERVKQVMRRSSIIRQDILSQSIDMRELGTALSPTGAKKASVTVAASDKIASGGAGVAAVESASSAGKPETSDAIHSSPSADTALDGTISGGLGPVSGSTHLGSSVRGSRRVNKRASISRRRSQTLEGMLAVREGVVEESGAPLVLDGSSRGDARELRDARAAGDHEPNTATRQGHARQSPPRRQQRHSGNAVPGSEERSGGRTSHDKVESDDDAATPSRRRAGGSKSFSVSQTGAASGSRRSSMGTSSAAGAPPVQFSVKR